MIEKNIIKIADYFTELKKSREELMRFLEVLVYAILYVALGIMFFGIDPEPMQALSVFAVMFLNMIYNVLRDIYDKFE